MCEPGDEKWLEDFYSRIMKQSDPLALYHKAIRTRSASKSTQKSSASKRTSHKKRKRKSTHRKIGCAVFMIIALIIAAIFIIKYNQILAGAFKLEPGFETHIFRYTLFKYS